MFKKILIVSVCAVLGACASNEEQYVHSGCAAGATLSEVMENCEQTETPEQTQKRIEMYYQVLTVMQKEANKNKSL